MTRRTLTPTPLPLVPIEAYDLIKYHSTADVSPSSARRSHLTPPPPNASAQHAEVHAHKFISFIKHLQGAALCIRNEAMIASVPNKYAAVLIVCWENDPDLIAETRKIESTLHHLYGFDVERCAIPLLTTPAPSSSLICLPSLAAIPTACSSSTTPDTAIRT